MSLLVVIGFEQCNLKQKTINQLAYNARKKDILEHFPRIPHDEILQQITGNRLYSELQEVYKNSLISLKNETDNDCAKLVVAIVTHEAGKNTTISSNYGIAYIIRACDNMNIECINLSEDIAAKNLNEIMLVPEEGMWSKAGAEYEAQILGDIIVKYTDQRSTKKIKGAKPATFGDLPPHLDEVIDKGQSFEYRMKVNGQGLRMDHDIVFPKTKQTVLILGDAKVLSPGLDNKYIATAILQRRFPDKEIINAGFNHYTMEDYETLYTSKARYTEPDLVIVCTDGGDILDNYFSQRNRYSRTQRIYPPTGMEENFYFQLYGNQQ